MIPTVVSLPRVRRCAATRLEKSQRVLAEMQRGAALHLQFTRQGPAWVLSTGRQIPDGVARVVITSASVIAVGDCLLDGCRSQTYRWWREPRYLSKNSKAGDTYHGIGTVPRKLRR